MWLAWSPFTESNRRPSPYHGDALPTELKGRALARAPETLQPARRGLYSGGSTEQLEHRFGLNAQATGGAGVQPRLESLLGQRSRDQVALSDVTPHRLELIARHVLLDAFGDHGQPERVTEFDDRAHQDRKSTRLNSSHVKIP